MDVIVCTTGEGNVLRTSVCTSQTVLEVEVLWSGLEFVMMVTLSSKLSRNIACCKIQRRYSYHSALSATAKLWSCLSTWQCKMSVARVCQDFLNQNHICVLPWPALSLDLSPIEHLWDELGRCVCHRQNLPETLQELFDALVHEWNNIPQAFIQRLIGSMHRRCEAAVAARGGHTRYWTPQTSILHDNFCLSMICSDSDVEKFCWYCLICYAHMNLNYTIVSFLLLTSVFLNNSYNLFRINIFCF